MKKLIFLLLVATSLTAYSQRYGSVGSGDTLVLNSGASDTTNSTVNKPGNNFFGGEWSYQLDYRNFDDVDATISLYYSNEPIDSGTYVLLWFDQDLDGSNDNPWTLSDTANGDFAVHGQYFPGKYFYRVLTRGSVSDSTTAYEKLFQR